MKLKILQSLYSFTCISKYAKLPPMKRFLILLNCFLLLCFSANAKKGNEVKIIDATTQHWVAGMPAKGQPGHGEHYVIKLYVNTSKEVSFTGLWIGGKSAPFQVQFVNSAAPKKIALGDSLLLDYNTAAVEDKSAYRGPVYYKGAARIECMIAGRPHYFIIKEFRKLPDYSGQ